MTNYNERLDTILANLCCSLHVLEVSDCPTCHPKQAITSLIRELVADAKPERRQNNHIHSPLEKAWGLGYDEAARGFEQNLLKALEDK